eukprot:Awhi_evm1s2352
MKSLIVLVITIIMVQWTFILGAPIPIANLQEILEKSYNQFGDGPVSDSKPNFDPSNGGGEFDPSSFLNMFDFSNNNDDNGDNVNSFIDDIFKQFLPPISNDDGQDDDKDVGSPKEIDLPNIFGIINQLTNSVFSLFNKHINSTDSDHNEDDSIEISDLISSFEGFFGENTEDETSVFEALKKVVNLQNTTNTDAENQALDELLQSLTNHINGGDNTTVAEKKEAISELNVLFSDYKEDKDSNATDANTNSLPGFSTLFEIPDLLMDVSGILLSLNDQDKIGIMFGYLASIIVSKGTLAELDQILGNTTSALIDIYANKTMIVDSLNDLMINLPNSTQMNPILTDEFETNQEQYVIDILKILESQQDLMGNDVKNDSST